MTELSPYIVLEGVPVDGVPTVHYSTVKPLEKQNQTESRFEACSKILNSSVSALPWGSVVPVRSSSPPGHQTFAPWPSLAPAPDPCCDAPGVPWADTLASVWEGRGSRGGAGAGVRGAAVASAGGGKVATLQTEGRHRRVLLRSRARRDLRTQTR